MLGLTQNSIQKMYVLSQNSGSSRNIPILSVLQSSNSFLMKKVNEMKLPYLNIPWWCIWRISSLSRRLVRRWWSMSPDRSIPSVQASPSLRYEIPSFRMVWTLYGSFGMYILSQHNSKIANPEKVHTKIENFDQDRIKTLKYLVISCHFCLFLYYFVRFCPTLSDFVQLCPILSNFVRFCPSLSDFVQLCATLSDFLRPCRFFFQLLPALGFCKIVFFLSTILILLQS